MIRVTIRWRLIVTLILLVSGLALLGSFIFNRLELIQSNAREVADLTELQVRVGDIQFNLNEIIFQLEQIQSEPTFAPALESSLAGPNVRLQILLTQASMSSSYPEALADFDVSYQILTEERTQRVEELLETLEFDALQTYVTQILIEYRALNAQLSNIQSDLALAVDRQNRETDEQVDDTTSRVFIAVLSLGVAIVALSISNIWSINSGITTLNEGAQRLAKDPINADVSFPTTRQDEFVELGDNFNVMAKAIRIQRLTIHDQVERLESARNTALESTQRKTNYLATMSHELRTPLHIILNFAALTLETDNLDETQTDYVQRIQDSAGNLLKTINSVLDLERIEAGQLILNPEPFHIDTVVREIQVSGNALLRDKPVDFIADATDEVPQIYGDETRVRQILLNLLGNAVRFTDEGFIRLSFGIGTREVTICMEDTGVGIPPEKRDVIFNRFMQDNKYDRGGTGLGLTITQELVRLHNGRIWVESPLQGGSRFCFTLPLAEIGALG